MSCPFKKNSIKYLSLKNSIKYLFLKLSEIFPSTLRLYIGIFWESRQSLLCKYLQMSVNNNFHNSLVATPTLLLPCLLMTADHTEAQSCIAVMNTNATITEIKDHLKCKTQRKMFSLLGYIRLPPDRNLRWRI